MTTLELAKDFTNILKRNDHEGAAAKYNADDIVSYEAMEGPMAVCRGRDSVKKKGEWWQGKREGLASLRNFPRPSGRGKERLVWGRCRPRSASASRSRARNP